MNRDGARKSIWQEEITRFSAGQAHHGAFDVAIIGGGITGVSTAYRLQAAGKKCVLIEANNIGFGTTGGTTAHLNSFFDISYQEAIHKFGLKKAKLLYQAGLEAIEGVESLVNEHRISCDFVRKPAQLFALDAQQAKALEKMVSGAEQVGQPMFYIPTTSYPIPFVKAACIPDQAQFHPIKFISALCKAYIDRGGAIIEDCVCTAHEEDTGSVTLTTTKGELQVNQVVYATHTPPGINLLHFTTAPYRSYAIAFTLKDGQYPIELGYDLSDPYRYYRTQEVNGRMVVIAGGEDHKCGHAEDTGACFSELENYCRQYFAIDQIVFSWSSQFYEPADGLPAIGVLPGSDGRVFVATGFSGNGMPFGSIAARILTELISTGESRYADLFQPNRFKPGAGFVSFIKENATVVKDMIVDKLAMKRITSFAEVPPGEAKVVKYEGEAYAVYREKDGQVHVLKSTCPHARCEVRWNSAELTWDCPCHGSRFGINGRLLNAPSTVPLPRIQ